MALQVSEDALMLFHKINDSITKDRSYNALMIKCYVCNKTGHIAKDCE